MWLLGITMQRYRLYPTHANFQTYLFASTSKLTQRSTWFMGSSGQTIAFTSRNRCFPNKKPLLSKQQTIEKTNTHEKALSPLLMKGLKRKTAASYSPALHCSTIGAGGLNFSVRNGKRWDPAAITTLNKSLARTKRKGTASIRLTSCTQNCYTTQSKSTSCESIRAISSARLCHHWLYTCTLSTS